MENIFLNTDWHLYSKKHEPHHPYRSRLDLALLRDNIGKDMTENDLWIYLGDLCDPEVANRDMIRRILETIPAHRVLVRGNRDTEEDQWYLDLGFNQVTEGLIIHNMLFTHKPQPVPMDWINIHGDLHFEQIAMDGTHINAFASNWNDACHPVLLDDLIRGAKIQKLKLPKFKSDKYQAQFHEDLETPSVTKFLDLTDAFQLYPMDEGISKLVGKGQAVWKTPAELKDWMHEHIEYDPEETSWKLRSPNEVLRDCRGNCHDQAYFAKRYLDLLGLDTYLIFLVEYAGPIVRNAGRTHTLVAYRDDHGKYYWFENAWGDESGINGPYNSLNALKQDVKKRWVKRPEYPKLYCGDATPIDHYGMNLNDYVEWNLPDRLLGETTTLAEAILFPDVETTKYFEADDNEYKRKAQKAEVDQDGNTAVTLDESDEAYGERIVAEQHQKLVEKVNGLAESLAESAKITKKQSNRSGPYQLFDMSLGYQKEPRYAAVLTEDILTSFMDVRPEDLDKDRIQSMTSTKELEDMFKEFAKNAASDISEDGYTTTARILAIALSHGLDTGDLIPKLDADAFIRYRDRRLEELERIEQMFIGVLLENYRRIGLSKAECDKLVSSSNTAKVIKQLKAAAKKHVKPNYSKDGTVEFDYQLFGRGKVCVAPNTFRGKLPNVGNMLKRALEYDYVIVGHGTDNNGYWVLDPAMTVDGTTFTDVSALVKHLKKQKPGAKILLAVCNTGHIEPVGSEWKDVRYSSYMTLFESAVPKADPLYDQFVHYDQLISALAVARNRMISVIKDADIYATGKGSIELLEIVPKTSGVRLSAYSKKLRDPKDFTKAAINAINDTSDMCYRMLRIARSIVQYMIKPTNESAFMWTNSTTLPLVGANVGLYHNTANLGFDTVDECLSDALDHIGYELVTGGQRIAESAIEIYDMSGNHVAEYNYDDLMESALLEGVQASSIDPNHKQNGHINLSHLKRVDVTKAYLAKRGKKGVLKDASPCTSTCKTVAWELDGRPIVTVAVGYQDKDCNWIGNMEVDPEFRGYGLGTQALKYAVDELEGDALAVFKANKLAIQIYKDHGFVLKNPDEFKNEDYVQMVLDETSESPIAVPLQESTKYFKKVDGPGGEYIAVDPALRKGKVGIMAADIIDELITVTPYNFDIRQFNTVKYAEDVVDFVGKTFVNIIKKHKGQRLNPGMDEVTAGLAMFRAAISLGDVDKFDYLDGLIPMNLDHNALMEWKDQRVEEAIAIDRVFTRVYNTQAMLIGASIVTSTLADSHRGATPILTPKTTELLKGVVDLTTQPCTYTFDYGPVGSGIAYVNEELIGTGFIRINKLRGILNKCDYIVISHGGDKNGVWTIDPVTINGKICKTADEAIAAIRSSDPTGKIRLYCCNPGARRPKEPNGVRYMDTNVLFEEAVPVPVGHHGSIDQYMDYAKTQRKRLFKDYNRALKRLNNGPKDRHPEMFYLLRFTDNGVKLKDVRIEDSQELGQWQKRALTKVYDAYDRYLQLSGSFMHAIARESLDESNYHWRAADYGQYVDYNYPQDRFGSIDECMEEIRDYVATHTDNAWSTNYVIYEGAHPCKTMTVDEAINQTISFQKGPGGHDQVHFNTTEKTKGGPRKFRGTLMAKDALYNAMRIAPQYIDRELLSAAKDMEDVAKVLSNVQIKHMKNWKQPADNTAYFGSMYYALMSEYDSDKAPKKSTLKRYMDLLPDLDPTALEVYLKEALQFLDDQMSLLTDALNAMVKAAGVTAAQGKLLLSSNEKELIRGFDALRMTDYMSKEPNTLIYDFSPINRGIVIVGKECVSAHGYETIVNLSVKCFVKAQRFDYVLMCEGHKDDSGSMSIEPITYQGKRFTDVESLVDYIDPAKRQTFWILACNDNQVILGDNSGRIEYADNLVIHESALPANPMQDAINDYVVRGELFRVWKGSVLKTLYKDFPDMIAPQSTYMKVHVKATGLDAKIKTLGVADGKKYCKKIDNIVDLYANAISSAKVLLSIINGRYGHSMVDETVGNSLMMDFATSSDTDSIIRDANCCAFDPFNSATITEEVISQINADLQPVLSGYSNLVETMAYLNLPHSPNSPLSMPSCVREGCYGGMDPFQVVTGTREPSRNPFAMEHFFDEAIATTASLDRGQKEDVADRYGLRDVGNTHEQEDRLQAELDAYKRKKAPTKAQLAKKREQDRLRYLKKARRVRKRKSIFRKIKRAFFPGVKNEAVDTVDNIDIESREIAEIRQEDTFGGDRKRYFDNKLQYANASEADDGPVIIEAVNPVRFFDRINEADTDVPHRSPIFVVSIADGAGLRIMMIGFSSNLKPAYALSFTENGTRAKVLSVDDGRSLTTTGKIDRVLTLALGTDDQTKALRSRLDYYDQNRTKLKTEGPKDPAMVVAGLLGIGDLPESYPLGKMDADYDPADIDRQVKSILGQKRIQERLEEGAIMNLHRSNPWQDQILEYQLGLVDEESFVAYLEKPKRIIRVDHSQINEPDYKEQNLEFEKRTKGKNYEANEIQRYHTIIGDAETV